MRYQSPHRGPDMPEWLQFAIYAYLAVGLLIALYLYFTEEGGQKMKVPFIAALAKQYATFAMTLPIWWAVMWWVQRTLTKDET
ncbi:hypothetical protein [Lacunisphaera limnophila]|nr:hypothetical protein [Lacunisphaera limnophila]